MPSDGRKGRVRPPETRRDRGETDAESMAWKSPHDSGPWHGIRNAHGQYGSRSRTGVGRRQIGVSMVKRARVGVTARTMDEPIKWVRIALLAAGLSALLAAPVSASSRIKDIASFEGIRDNLLIGYGLVVGLNGTGDTLNNAIFTIETYRATWTRPGLPPVAADIEHNVIAPVLQRAHAARPGRTELHAGRSSPPLRCHRLCR